MFSSKFAGALAVGALTLAFAAPSYASAPESRMAEEATFHLSGYFGDGCDGRDSVQVAQSDDGQAFSMTFSELGAAAETATSERRTCQVDGYITPPEGYSVDVRGFDLRGYAQVRGRDARAQLIAVLNVDGKHSASVDRTWTNSSGQDGNFMLRGRPMGSNWTNCNQSLPMTLNLGVMVTKGKDSETAQVALDSMDQDRIQKLHYALRPCR